MPRKKLAEDHQVQERLKAYLRQYMRKKNIHQTQFAEWMQIDNSFISKVLKNDYLPSAGRLLRICARIGVSPDRLFGHKTDADDPPPEYFVEGSETDPVRPVRNRKKRP